MELINQPRNNKLISNFLIILTLLGLNFVFIGGSYYKIDQLQQLSLAKNNDVNHLSSLTDGMQLDILEVSHYAKNVELSNEPGDLATFDEKTSKVKKSLSEIKNLMRSDDDKRFIVNLEETMTRYEYNFHNAIKLSAELESTEKSAILVQFNNRMKDISNIVTNAKDEKLTEKYLVLQNLQENYLKVKDDITPQQVIVAQKNFLDRVNRSSGDYANISKMMVQTISLMQTFELLKNSFEEKKFLLKQVEADKLQLQASLKQLLAIKDTYENQDEQLVTQTEQQSFILFLVSIILVLVSFVTAWFLLNRSRSEPMMNHQKISANP